MSSKDLEQTTEKHLERARAILDGPDTQEKQALLALLSKPAEKDAAAMEPDSPILPAGPDKDIQTTVAAASTDTLKPRTTIMGRDFTDVRWATEGSYKGQPWLAPVKDYKPGYQQDVMVRDPKLNREISGIIEKRRMSIDNLLTFSIEIDGTKFGCNVKTWKGSDMGTLDIDIFFTDPTDQKKYNASLVLSPVKERGALTYTDKIPGYKDGDYTGISGWNIRKMHPDGSGRYAMDNEDDPSKLATPERVKLLEGIKLDRLLAEINQRTNS